MEIIISGAITLAAWALAILAGYAFVRINLAHAARQADLPREVAARIRGGKV